MCTLALQRYLLLLTFKPRSTVPHLYKAVVQISKGILLEWTSFTWLVQLSDLVSVADHCGCHPFNPQTSQHSERCVQPSVAQCLWVCTSWDGNSGYMGHLCSGESHPGGSGTFQCCLQMPPSEKSQKCQCWVTLVKAEEGSFLAHLARESPICQGYWLHCRHICVSPRQVANWSWQVITKLTHSNHTHLCPLFPVLPQEVSAMRYNFGLWDLTLVSSKLKGKVKTNKQKLGLLV